MSVSSLGASSNAFSYLQSLLHQQRANSSQSGSQPADPLSTLLDSFYPGANSAADAANSAAGAANSAASPAQNVSVAAPSISPDTMTNLLAVQAQDGPQRGRNDVAAHAHDLFGQFDTNGDGQISKSEFEKAFGSGADMTKVDGLFNALDSNQDGAIGENELTSAAESAASHHHHRHHAHGAGSGDGSSLLDMLKSGADGATRETTSNADGSTTTTISYADGSKVSMTSPAAAASGANTDNQVRRNVLEQLIALQAQWSTQASSTGSTSGTAAI